VAFYTGDRKVIGVFCIQQNLKNLFLLYYLTSKMRYKIGYIGFFEVNRVWKNYCQIHTK